MEADPKEIDFGQLSLGSRVLKTFKIVNKSHDTVYLGCSGINAVGPFQVIKPPKSLAPGEVKNIMVECLLARPGMSMSKSKAYDGRVFFSMLLYVCMCVLSLSDHLRSIDHALLSTLFSILYIHTTLINTLISIILMKTYTSFYLDNPNLDKLI